MRWVVAAAVLLAVWGPVLASANADTEGQFTALIGRERAAAGLGGYASQGDLADVARGQAQRMAAEHRLYHNPNLANEVQGWDAIGENVGRGPSVEEIHRAFMDSPTHRREILSTTFTQVGVGVAIADDGEIWVAEVFRKPTPAAIEPAPAPALQPSLQPNPNPAPTRATRARTASPPPAPAPVAVLAATPAPPTTTAPTTTTIPDTVPELLAMSAAVARPVAAPAPADDPDVDIAVRVAATLLVLVVAAQTRYVVRVAGGIRLISSPRRTLVASAATLP